METANLHNKLILAVVQEDDYDATVSELNQNGFFVTMLSSTGGFWKKKNTGAIGGLRNFLFLEGAQRLCPSRLCKN